MAPGVATHPLVLDSVSAAALAPKVNSSGRDRQPLPRDSPIESGVPIVRSSPSAVAVM